MSNLFHIDKNVVGKIRNVGNSGLSALQPHYSGLYPDPVNPIIRTLDSTSAGFDFVSAIESDLIVFLSREQMMQS